MLSNKNSTTILSQASTTIPSQAPTTIPSQASPILEAQKELFTYALSTEVAIIGVAALGLVWQKIVSPWLLNTLNGLIGKRAYSYDIELERLLAEMVGRTDSCRVLIYEFHNGETLFSGRAFEKVSITSEYRQPGSSPMIKEFRNSPISIIASTINELEKTPYLTRNLKECLTDSHARFLCSWSITHSVNVLLVIHDRPVGMLEIQIDNQVKVISDTLSKIKPEIEELAERIQHLLINAANSKSLWKALIDVATTKGK